MEFVAFALFVWYLLPWIVAVACDHPRHAAILVLDLLLGWTVVGWFAALAWALRREDPALTRPSRSSRLRVFEGGGEIGGERTLRGRTLRVVAVAPPRSDASPRPDVSRNHRMRP